MNKAILEMDEIKHMEINKETYIKVNIICIDNHCNLCGFIYPHIVGYNDIQHTYYRCAIFEKILKSEYGFFERLPECLAAELNND